MKCLTSFKRFALATIILFVGVNLWGQEPTLTGAGTEGEPYQIGSSTDWAIFAYWINDGTNANAHYKLTANIQTGTGVSNDVYTNGTMVGTEDHPFQGTFDGGGYTLTFYYNSTNEDVPVAPFLYTYGAKFKDLNVLGRIQKDKNGAAGLIGINEIEINEVTKTTTVENTTVGVSIYCFSYYSEHCGGFAVDGCNVQFDNCVFNGSMIVGDDDGVANKNSGGFCGLGNSGTKFNKCLYGVEYGGWFYGENFAYTTTTIGAITDCYYTYGDYDETSTQGTKAKTKIDSNKIGQKIDNICGINVYDDDLISVEITFTNTDTQDEYTKAPYAEQIIVGFIVKFDDVAVAPGEGKYKYTITDSYGGSTVQDIGEYTFKVEGNKTNNYYGSATRHFYVTAPDTYGNWDDLKAALSASGPSTVNLDRNYKEGVGGSGVLLINRDVVINLNGFTIDRNLTEATEIGHVIKIVKNGNKRPRVSIIGPGVIKGAYNKAANGIERKDSNDGGGIYNMGYLTLDKVTISDNKCVKENSEANNTNPVGRGGGIYSGKGSTLTMTNVIIRANEAKGGGGGVFADGAESFTMSENCSVRSNESSDKGGGIRVKNCDTATITDCVINSNTVDNHTTESVANGGGIHLDSGSLTLDRCTINNNRAYKYGAGIYVIKGEINVNNCAIKYNMAFDEDLHNEGRGGGIYMHGGTLNLNGGSIQGNASNKSYGGGIYINSAATFNLTGSATISSNINYLSSGSSNNTNVYLVGASKINIEGSIAGSNIGVSTNIGESVFTTGLSGNGNTSLFTSDNGDYEVSEFNNEAKLVILHPWTPDDPDEGGYVWINDAVALSRMQTVTGNGIKFGDNGSLTILPGGYLDANITNSDPTKLIIHGGQLVTTSENVQATMKKDISAALALNGRFWYLISSGIANPNITSNTNLIKMSANDYPEYDLYRFNESVTNNLQWENYRNAEHTDFTTLENGRGYLYRNGNDYTISISGTLNTAATITTQTLTCTGTSETNLLKGFNIIGNPYSHNIKKGDGQAIPNGDLLESNYYVLLEDSTWEPVDDGEEIHVMEGILVQARKSGTLTISKIPVHAPVEPASKDEGCVKAGNDKIWFTINNAEFKDRACVEFKSGHGLNKIAHPNENAPMLYIHHNGEDFASVDMNPDAKSFNLNFEAKTMGFYTLSVKLQGEYSYLRLIDKLADKDIDLLIEDEYTFVGSASDSKDRFVVRLSETSGNDDKEVFAYQSGNEIIVSGEGELQIFDVMGRMVATQYIDGVGTWHAASTQTGVYILKLNGMTQKIVIR